MARVNGVPPSKSGPRLRLVYFFLNRAMAPLTGKAKVRFEPLEIYATIPALALAHANLEKTMQKIDLVDKPVLDLAELKVATVIDDEFQIDLSSLIARVRSRVSDEQLRALDRHADSELFTDAQKLAMDYAVAMTRTPPHVPDEMMERLRRQFTDPQFVELTYTLALANLRCRANVALGVEAFGFSKGRVRASAVMPLS